MSVPDFLFAAESLKIVAVQPSDLEEHLCKWGCLSVIGNEYVRPDETELATKAGAISRIFVGPANCGKTRAAYEWITSKIDINLNDWVIFRTLSGSISLEANKYELDWTDRDTERPRKPNRAILFVDDLPEFLPPPGTDPGATNSVSLLLSLFDSVPGLKERCFVGTMRSERLIDKPQWPEKLAELQLPVRVIKLEALGEEACKELWQGLVSARAEVEDSIRELGLQIDDEFINGVADCKAEPEAITYFARAMAVKGIETITKDDLEKFSDDVIKIWINETWPAIRDAYGDAASIFYTLARLLEAGIQTDTSFKGSLTPKWEYHSVLGPALLQEMGGNPEEYIRLISKMLLDGHASGLEKETIRPKFDFLLQAPALPDVTIKLPTTEWFATHSIDLSTESQIELSYHFSGAEQEFTGENVSANWLFGYALAVDYLLERNEPEVVASKERAISAYDLLINRYGDDDAPEVREQVAKALFNKGVTLGKMDRLDDEVAAYKELAERYGDDDAPEVREKVAKALVNKGYIQYTLWQQTQNRVFLTLAIEVNRKCVSLGGKTYNLACLLALDGQLDEAFKYLDISLGGKTSDNLDWEGVEKDSDWEDHRQHPRYLELEDKYKNGK